MTASGTIAALEAAYGQPSQAGFGSAVFTERIAGDERLEDRALGWYRHFLGDRWTAETEAAWMGPWGQAYERPADAKADIVAELRGITDQHAATSVPMILEVVENAEAARAALSAVYDDAAITELRVFALGDGEAMSGLLVAGRSTTGDAVFLVFLLD
jgi:hypothetical protein